MDASSAETIGDSSGSSDLAFIPDPGYVALMDAMAAPLTAEELAGLVKESDVIKPSKKVKAMPWVSALEVPDKDNKRKIVPIFGVKVEF